MTSPVDTSDALEHPAYNLYKFAEDFHPRALKYNSAEDFQQAESLFYRAVSRGLTEHVEIGINLINLMAFADNKDVSDAVSAYLDQIIPFETSLGVAMAYELEQAERKAQGMGMSAAGQELGLTLDFDVNSPAAQAYARASAVALVKGITDTTKERMGAALRNGLAAGEDRNKIAERLRAIQKDIPEWRAKLIAQTETIRAYTGGQLMYYKEAGIEQIEWIDGQSGACPTCVAHNRSVVGIEDGFSSNFGAYSGPPAHPGCRCTTGAVVVDNVNQTRPGRNAPDGKNVP